MNERRGILPGEAYLTRRDLMVTRQVLDAEVKRMRRKKVLDMRTKRRVQAIDLITAKITIQLGEFESWYRKELEEKAKKKSKKKPQKNT